RGMRVDDVRPETPKFLDQTPEGERILMDANGSTQPGDANRAHALSLEDVVHLELPGRHRAGEEPRLEAVRWKPSSKRRHVDRGAADAEARDHTRNPHAPVRHGLTSLGRLHGRAPSREAPARDGATFAELTPVHPEAAPAPARVASSTFPDVLSI